MPRRCWPRSIAPPRAPGARRAARPAAPPRALVHPLVARAIRECRTTRPDVSFVLEESSSSDLLSGLREERLDIAFIRSGLADTEGLTVHALLQEAVAGAAFTRRVGRGSPRIVSTLNLVAAGLGITIVPASLSRLPLEGVTYRPLKGRPALKGPLTLASPAD